LGILNQEKHIELQDMVRVDLFVNMTDVFRPSYGGRYPRKKMTLKKINKRGSTRKQRIKILSFSNDCSYGM
jgi:hypothetical protein